MRTTLCTLLMVLSLGGIALAKEPPVNKKDGPITHVDAAATAKLLADKKKDQAPVILDIRTPKEFQAGHLKGATNIDFLADGFADRLAKLDREKPYVVY